MITKKEAKKYLQNTLLKYHASKLIPIELAAKLNLSVDKIESLITMTGIDLFHKSYTDALHGDKPQEAVKTVADLVKKVLPLSVLFHKSFYDKKSLKFIRKNKKIFSVNEFNSIIIESIEKFAVYEKFADISDESGFSKEEIESNPEHLHLSLKALDNDTPDSKDISFIAKALQIKPVLAASVVNTLKTAKLLPKSALESLQKIEACSKVAKNLGVSGDTLRLIVSDDYDDLSLASDAILGAFRAKYSDDKEWKKKSDPFEDLIRSCKRDGLTDYLIHSTPTGVFSSEKELYQYFLIDVELTGCARTSRLVAAMSSLQLYVHRVLMNLEQTKAKKGEPGHLQVNIDDRDDFINEWKWRKNYRVWEANRKVFLFPETYIEPELRDNKTPLFEELESTLLQQEVNEQNVLDAYAVYMTGFEEVAKLKIAGSYHDKNTKKRKDILHLFGVTPSDPPIYYYRAVENAHYGEVDPNKGIIWNPWKKIDVQIPVRKVSPIVFQGRLYVFWMEIVTSPKNQVIEGNSVFVGYKHKLTVKYTMLRLDNTWIVPQEILLPEKAGVVYDLLASTELQQLIWGKPEQLKKFIDIYNDAGNKYDRPKYDLEREHFEPKDEYTLTGFLWDQVYLSKSDEYVFLNIAGNSGKCKLDLYSKKGIRFVSGQKHTLEGVNYSDSINLIWVKMNTPIPDISEYAFRSMNVHIKKTTNGTSNPNSPVSIMKKTPFIKFFDKDNSMSIINGFLENMHIDVQGDLLLLQRSGFNNSNANRHFLKRIGTTLSDQISKILFSGGIDSLLAINTQKNKLGEASFPVVSRKEKLIDLKQKTIGKIDFTGPYGTYYREIFFHIPFLIANHLNSQQKFEAAQKWYRYIFDPTANEKTDPPRDSNWRYLEFRNLDLPNLRKMLLDEDAIETYKRDPFNPHAIARLRLTAYQKSIVMKYIDNLLDWGDKLFSRFTMESVNEATMLYIMAADILGDHPVELGECGEGELEHRDYENIKPLMEKGSEFLVEVETLTKKRDTAENDGGVHSVIPPKREFMKRDLRNSYDAAEAESSNVESLMRTDWNITSTASWSGSSDMEHKADYDSVHIGQNSEASNNASEAMLDTSSSESGRNSVRGTRPPWRQSFEMYRQAGPVFCFPVNKDLMSYWDRVDDRLYKIRHCMDIKGVRRKLELFAPEIDPRLLVRAKAAGLSIEDVLDATSGDLPPYRFEYLIQKAKSYAGTVQSFGASLLSALEKKDTEELNRLRLIHEQNIQKLTTKIKEWEIKIEKESIETLKRQQKETEYTKSYYKGLIDGGLNSSESLKLKSRNLASTIHIYESILGVTAAITGQLPQYGSPFSINYGGTQLEKGFSRFAGALNAIASGAENISISAGLDAENQRREQGWKHQFKLAEHGIKQIEKKLIAAEIRKDIVKKSLELHKKSIEQTEEMFKLYGSKFSNFGLYTWLSKTLHGLYRDAYNSAFSMARLAEQAYQFERGYDATITLGAGSWDASKSGLLAGERLTIALQQMEQRFIETNYRTMEIDQSFSLAQIDPLALMGLRENGSCDFEISELFFNLFYPGHYRRKIKAVRISIPCITGPYVNVGANLRLTGSKLRNEPKLDTENDNFLKDVPLQRSVSIATSKAQNDGGVFEFNFHDERYMPFEGAGAVDSKWKLTLPNSLRQFDYDTISDVILHISYTSEESTSLRTDVEKRNADIEKVFMKKSMSQAFSMKNDFATEWHKFMHPAIGGIEQALKFIVGKNRFPFFAQDKKVAIDIDEVYIFVKCNQKLEVECAKSMKLEYRDEKNNIHTKNIIFNETPSFTLNKNNYGELMYSSISTNNMDIDKEIGIEYKAANVENIFLVVHYKLGEDADD